MEDDSVDDLRQRGNHEFQLGNLDHAIALYTAAIETATSAAVATITTTNSTTDKTTVTMTNALVVNLCNRSACYFQLEEFESAMKDALQAWTLSNESNVKAAYRLSKTYLALREPQKAVPVLQAALAIPDLDPKEISSMQELLQQAIDRRDNPTTTEVEHSIKGVKRPISIREFTKGQSLGVGNFSEIIVVTHNVTEERFALKILEKKQAADLAKRQHPNVYNEIAMERRVLLERLPSCSQHRVITMYHAFQDFNSLYYLMDLHDVNTDLWSCLRYKGNMVGAHPSMTKRWLLQIIDALEHMHKHGIVHRDLKPENILKTPKNHIVIIDLGTAKDLVVTDLNGPEFVGTPDFMSVEQVVGFSGMPKDDPENHNKGATHCADLWALGGIAYILHTGSCPFWSPSPYLTFLRIKRGLLPRDSWALPDDDAWDFCRSLIQVDPSKRLGADCFQVVNEKVTVQKGYAVLRNHPYFQTTKEEKDDDSHVIPSLQDLALRACAELVQQDAVDLDICDQHPPGDKSSHDLMRLSQRQRDLICHILDKSKVFKDGDETRVLQRFFDKDIDFVKAKVRPTSRDFVGLTQMNDDEYKPQSQRGSQDPYATKEDPVPTKIAILRNPWLTAAHQDENSSRTPEQEKSWLKGWKSSIACINKQRPKAVVVCAPHIPPKYWKFIARIRDSIPVIWNDGSVFYSFWLNGFQGIVIQKSGFDVSENSGIEDTLQMKWLKEQMEQARMAKQQLFCFCDCNPHDLPALVLKRLARGRVLCLYGASEEDLDYTLSYAPNETVDDDVSVKSTDSVEDDQDAQTMRVISSSKNGLEWLTVDEKEKWQTSFEDIDIPSASYLPVG
jgi:serine/threonine protein kinase